jgi:hypothetical protein
MLRSFVAVALGIAACSGSQPASDGGQKCIRAAYDPCNTEHDCDNMNCKPFTTLGASICTQSCSPGDMTCPPQNGSAVTCNANGLCEPAMPNSCRIQ